LTFHLQGQNLGSSADGRREIRIGPGFARRLFAGAFVSTGWTRGRTSSMRTPQYWFSEVKEPQEAGLNLLVSGEFGRVGNKIRIRRKDLDFSRHLRDRTSHPRRVLHREDIIRVGVIAH
jgi:hypothetical protein